MDALQARKIVLNTLNAITGKLPADRDSVMAYIESAYILNSIDWQAIYEQVCQLCQVKKVAP
jgi:hypothetical protein